MFGEVVQHQIQCLIFASQQRNVSDFSHEFSTLKNTVECCTSL